MTSGHKKMTATAKFDRRILLRGLHRLADMARRDGKVVDVALYGGSAIVFAYEFRASTMDVDAVFSDPRWVRQAAAAIAADEGWPETWLNDGVKGFLSDNQVFEEPVALPDENPGLRVFVPAPEYLFAMKCMAMRLGTGGDKSDLGDIRSLLGVLKLVTAEQALHIVEQFYPRARISPKVQFGIMELFQKLRDERDENGATTKP
jgi:hypothetical protein